MKRALVPTNDAEMQIPISGSWQDLESSKFEFRLRFSMFQPINTRHGSTASGASQAQATKSLSAAQKGITSRNSPRSSQAAAEKAIRRCRIALPRSLGCEIQYVEG
ncbi:MAG: hypothetical protein DME87_01870 [Verrucomicrobia bacterium]|nr:MAG: hypothetical protein DME87_01870 [Verrucomicrobiota bacterium]